MRFCKVYYFQIYSFVWHVFSHCSYYMGFTSKAKYFPNIIHSKAVLLINDFMYPLQARKIGIFKAFFIFIFCLNQMNISEKKSIVSLTHLIAEENYKKQLFVIPKLPAGGTACSWLTGWWKGSVLWLVGVQTSDNISWVWGCSSGWLGGVTSLSTWKRTVSQIFHTKSLEINNHYLLLTSAPNEHCLTTEEEKKH